MKAKYYFAKSKFQFVENVKDLGPAHYAEIGEAYYAFRWSNANGEYVCSGKGVYKGDEYWTDEHGFDVSSIFKWADYLVKSTKC